MANFQANNYAAFSNVADACSYLDLGVLSDIREKEGVKAPEVLGVSDAYDPPMVPCFALGEKQDHSAGLHGFSFTPYFDSMLELDDFCKKHMQQIREIAKQLEEGAPYPSKDWWK